MRPPCSSCSIDWMAYTSVILVKERYRRISFPKELMEPKYLPTWNSLRTHRTPQWFRDAKFGIYTHWGIYSVPAHGPNGTWYPYFMYREGSPQYEYHLKTYGHPSKFGYKDFIPMFTAEKFDPDEWAELFKQAGAKFAGPVGEHHDGFAMWDTRYLRVERGQDGSQAKCGQRVGEGHPQAEHAFHGRAAPCRELVVLPPLAPRI